MTWALVEIGNSGIPIWVEFRYGEQQNIVWNSRIGAVTFVHNYDKVFETCPLQ